jgi:hypothetical protein
LTAANPSWPTNLEESMTPRTSIPDKAMIADLPATLAGLWTAITLTHHLAENLAIDPADGTAPETPEGPAGVASHCALAADSLAASRPEAIAPSADLLQQHAIRRNAGLPDLGALTSGCIDLAVELLGNEDEPLTPVEVLAITRAVTALCSARALTLGGPA